MRSVVIDPRKRRPFDKPDATADGKVSRQPSGAPLSSPDYSIYDRYIEPLADPPASASAPAKRAGPSQHPSRAAGHLAAEPLQQIQALFVPAPVKPTGRGAAGVRWPPRFNHSPPGGTTNTMGSNMQGYQ